MGRFVARMMNSHNAAMNAFAVRLLDLQPSDRVLEVGFGGGVTLPSLIGAAAFLGAVDRSQDVVAWAHARYSRDVASGKADFREGTVESIPFGANAFNKVCTVNTVYFWSSLEAGLAEIYRVLVPGGRTVIGFLPKEWMDRMSYPADIFTSRAPAELIAALEEAGFKKVRVERATPTTQWNVVVAER
jgi:arsenite methyltransferase